MTGAIKMMFAGFCVVLLLNLPLNAQQTFGNWKITPATDGNSFAMVVTNPTTPLNIESEMDYQVDNAGVPSKAMVTFKTGVHRGMSAEEVDFYWSLLKGAEAYWDYTQAQGKVNSFTSESEQIPFSFLGRTVRVISKEGKYFVGILSQNTNTPDWFALTIKGNRILFYRKAVKEIQAIK
jgi:hypothetical protein